MKILFASDIHGNADRLKRLVDTCVTGEFDRFVVTGDITGYFGRGLSQILDPVKEIMTMALGNCDSEATVKSFEIPYYEDYGVFSADGINIFYTHGHMYNEYNLIPLLKSGDVLVSGHTHIPDMKTRNGIHFLNPGSASKPRGGSVASYMVYQDGRFDIKDFDGNVIMCTEVCNNNRRY